MSEKCTVSDGNSITFVERRTWEKYATPEQLEELRRNQIIDILPTTYGFMFIVSDITPVLFGRSYEPAYKLIRISTNEETGAPQLDIMPVTGNQALQVKSGGEWFE